MTRYTINIGDDFPIGDDDEPGRPGERPRGPRFGLVLKVILAISLLAIVVQHPFHVALITGFVLLVRRHPRFLELRSRMRGMRMGGSLGAAREAWRRGRHERRHERRHGRHPGRVDDRQDARGYGTFV